eukprot:TRINITY_DN22824_c0_g1_i1.p1 TRINITY_DN22824_c0_g1~~TRINITY_DN22824_c0_g1_i1.p1  ORF type:complete len:270 (-),score=26.82 TRINITY_DN22824_c0_g1_i1:225-926(-)
MRELMECQGTERTEIKPSCINQAIFLKLCVRVQTAPVEFVESQAICNAGADSAECRRAQAAEEKAFAHFWTDYLQRNNKSLSRYVAVREACFADFNKCNQETTARRKKSTDLDTRASTVPTRCRVEWMNGLLCTIMNRSAAPEIAQFQDCLQQHQSTLQANNDVLDACNFSAVVARANLKQRRYLSRWGVEPPAESRPKKKDDSMSAIEKMDDSRAMADAVADTVVWFSKDLD